MAAWSIPLELIAERQKQRIEDVVQFVTILLFTRVVIRSPVDTGRFRANWNVAYGAIDFKVTNNTDTSVDGRASQAHVRIGVLALPVGGIVYLTNSLPYAEALEYGLYPNPPNYGSRKRGEDGPTIHVSGGYSMQAPAGMVRVTAQEFAYELLKSLNLSVEP